MIVNIATSLVYSQITFDAFSAEPHGNSSMKNVVILATRILFFSNKSFQNDR